jgi:hypothetical protein
LVAAHKVGVLTAVIFAPAFPISAAAQIPDLARRDWSVNAKLSLATNPPSEKQGEVAGTAKNVLIRAEFAPPAEIPRDD